MNYALYLNGIYQGVLEEIYSVQAEEPDHICYLQPYKAERIVRFVNSPPSQSDPITLYASITSALSQVHYKAEIVGWENKSELSEERLSELNDHIAKFQPGEEDIYLTNNNGEKCVNLIAIRKLERVKTPIHVSNFVKLSNNQPLKERTRAGNWSYVKPIPEWVGSLDNSVIASELEADLDQEVSRSKSQTSTERKERLSSAPRQPEAIQVISKGFRRNADVVAEVLYRANGICEECKSPAPFIRASNGTPYLEVHHIRTLANGGEDTVENAIAVCPNCHRKLHFGMDESEI